MVKATFVVRDHGRGGGFALKTVTERKRGSEIPWHVNQKIPIAKGTGGDP